MNSLALLPTHLCSSLSWHIFSASRFSSWGFLSFWKALMKQSLWWWGAANPCLIWNSLWSWAAGRKNRCHESLYTHQSLFCCYICSLPNLVRSPLLLIEIWGNLLRRISLHQVVFKNWHGCYSFYFSCPSNGKQIWGSLQLIFSDFSLILENKF